MSSKLIGHVALALILSCALISPARGQTTVMLPNGAFYNQPKAPIVERLGPNRIRIGKIQVDTAAHEVSVSGHINDVPTLEWVANTENGFKAYESAISADTDAIAF